MNICRRGRNPPPQTKKKSHSFIQNCCWTTASFTSSRIKDLCHKWKEKLIFWGGWNSLMAWSDWPRLPPPIFYNRSMPLPYKLLTSSAFISSTDWIFNTVSILSAREASLCGNAEAEVGRSPREWLCGNSVDVDLWTTSHILHTTNTQPGV